MIDKLYTDLYTHKNILSLNEDSSDAIFPCNYMGVLNIDLNNINCENTNYDEDDPDTIILIKLLAWHIKSEKPKALKKR